MPTVTWPSELPSALPIDTDQEAQDLRLRWQPDLGPSKMRRITSAEPVEFKPPPILFSESQVELLEEFYLETLDGGAEPFDWPNPWPGAGVLRFRFATRPTYRWRTMPVNVTPDMIVTGSANPQRLARVALELEWHPWAPFELEATATLTLANRLTVSGVDLAANGIAAGDFAYFAADGRGKATAISGVTLPSILNLAAAYPVGPVGRSGAVLLVKVLRS